MSGLLDRLVDSNPLPSWLTEADLDYFASQLVTAASEARSIAIATPNAISNSSPPLTASRLRSRPPFSLAVSMPFCAWYPGVDMVELMRRQFTDLRYVRLIEDAGRWLQQEWPAEVNAALLEFSSRPSRELTSESLALFRAPAKLRLA
jgi:hypothetical protein